MVKKKVSATAAKQIERRFKQYVADLRQAPNEANGNDDAAHALAWEVVEAGVRYVDDWPIGKLLLLRPMPAEGAAILATHLARPKPQESNAQYLPGWHVDVDALVFRAMRVAPEAFAAAEASYEEWAKLGLRFVRWRLGTQLSAPQAESVVTELARSTARHPFLGESESILAVDAQGVEARFSLGSPGELRALAEAILPQGGAARFDEALAEATRANGWQTITSVAPALVVMPRSMLVAQLASRKCSSRDSDASVDWYTASQALALFETRLAAGTDAPSDLFAIARTLVEDAATHGFDRGDPPMLAMVLVLAAARRVPDAVPNDLEAIVSFARVVAYASLLRVLLAILRALPASRVHTWIEAAAPTDAAAVVALAAHSDDALLENVLRGSAPLEVAALAALGPPALSVLTRTMNTLPAEQAARARHAFVFVLAAAVAEGSAPPEDLDLELLVAAFDGRPIEREPYGNALREATEHILAAMPAERRATILTTAYGSAPMSVMPMLQSLTDDAELTTYLGTAVVDGMVTDWVLQGLGARALPALITFGGQSKRGAWVREQAEQGLSAADFARVADAFEAGEKWRAIERDVAAANALAPGAARTRVYLLEKASWGTPAREGSRSRLGGRAPGLPGWMVPKDDDGWYRHILTIDLGDVPELRQRYPEASALSLFTPSPEDGSAVEASQIVPVPIAAATDDTRKGGGEALAVFGFDISPAVFDDPDTLAPGLRSVRDRILHAGGHVLGRPFWIHTTRSQDDGDAFVMQLNDGLHDELHLGDGALYVYAEAIIVESL